MIKKIYSEKDKEILEKFCDAVNLDKKRINFLRKEGRVDLYAEVAITNIEFVEPILDIKESSFISKASAVDSS